ncbi:4'-phosphopantetheinyl transferase family protein [Psychroserpens sp.]
MSKVFCGTTQVSHEDFRRLADTKSDLQVFKIKLSSYYHLVSELVNYLSASELQRAQNYHFEKDKNRYIICRAILKFILARSTSLDISEIHVETDENKKPYLSSHPSVYFNLSHAEDYAIIALNKSAVGIDTEYVNRDFNYSEVLSYVFNTQETDTLLKSDKKSHTFFKFWTRKEAIVKVTGKGISDHLPQIPAIDGHHKVDSKLLDGFKKLQVLSFDLNENYVASIAISGENLNLDKLLIYNLPSSIEGLIAFSHIKTS